MTDIDKLAAQVKRILAHLGLPDEDEPAGKPVPDQAELFRQYNSQENINARQHIANMANTGKYAAGQTQSR